MINCKDCRYWNRESEETMIVGMYPCKHPKIADCSDMSAHSLEYLPDGVYYSDYEEFRAILTTGPEFGCVLGEANEKT